jgi:hypothetical protein
MMNKNGFAPILIVLAIAGLFALGGGVLLRKIRSEKAYVPPILVSTSTSSPESENEPIKITTSSSEISTGTISKAETKETSKLQSASNTPIKVAITSIVVNAFGPVELHVYDAQNRHTGPLPTGDIEIGIPDSNFDSMELNYSVNLSLDGGPYRIEMKATQDMKSDLEISGYGPVSSPAATYPTNLLITYLNVPLRASSTATIHFDISKGILLKESLGMVLSNGLNAKSSQVAPTAILFGEKADDPVPPAITFLKIPRIVKVGDTVMFNFSVTDELSGVAYAEALLDGKAIKSGDSIKFIEVGDHLLDISAADNAGKPSRGQYAFKVTTSGDDISFCNEGYIPLYMFGEFIPRPFPEDLQFKNKEYDSDQELRGALMFSRGNGAQFQPWLCGRTLYSATFKNIDRTRFDQLASVFMKYIDQLQKNGWKAKISLGDLTIAGINTTSLSANTTVLVKIDKEHFDAIYLSDIFDQANNSGTFAVFGSDILATSTILTNN